MDLKKYYLDKVQSDEYYYFFHELINNGTDIYEIYNIKDAISCFKKACQPENENNSKYDAWFYLTLFYMYKNGYVIEEFPDLVQQPQRERFEFVNTEIRKKIGKDEKGQVSYDKRRSLISQLTFTLQSIPDGNNSTQTISFEDIRNKIVKEIREAKYMILIAVAWFTDPILYDEILKKKQQGLIIEICVNDCDQNHNTKFSLEKEFSVYWINIQSKYQNIMHEKFCVIDLNTSIHGSFNWTNAANFNKEQVSIDKNNRPTAEAFADEFMRLKNTAKKQ